MRVDGRINQELLGLDSIFVQPHTKVVLLMATRCELMLRNHIGVGVEQEVAALDIDQNYFIEEK